VAVVGELLATVVELIVAAREGKAREGRVVSAGVEVTAGIGVELSVVERFQIAVQSHRLVQRALVLDGVEYSHIATKRWQAQFSSPLHWLSERHSSQSSRRVLRPLSFALVTLLLSDSIVRVVIAVGSEATVAVVIESDIGDQVGLLAVVVCLLVAPPRE
jgi:hypothetical protein